MKHEGPGHRRRRLHRLARRRPAARPRRRPRGSSISAPRPTTRRSEVETFTGSITDPANLDLAMRDCDAVIHLAAVADVGHVLADPVLAEEVNTRGTLNVLEAACRAKVGARRLRLDHLGLQRLRGAGGRRGDADPGAAPPLHRDQARRRDLLRRLRRALRPRVDGAALRHPVRPRARAAGVVAKFTDLAFEGKALTIAGDGSTTRSFIYVEDLADGIVAALRARGRGPHLQPLRRRGRDDPRNRRAGAGKHRRLRDRPHAAAPGRLPRQGDLQRARARGARLEGRDQLQRRRQAVRRMGASARPARRTRCPANGLR